MSSKKPPTSVAELIGWPIDVTFTDNGQNLYKKQGTITAYDLEERMMTVRCDGFTFQAPIPASFFRNRTDV